MLIDNLEAGVAADVAIIGAGTAGLFMAARLGKAGLKVLVLEAGPKVATTAPVSKYALSSGRSYPPPFTGRAFGLGGTSTMWGGQLCEFDSFDFDRGFAQWPIGLEDLKPHYDKVYEDCELPARLTDAEYRYALGSEVAQDDELIERFFTVWLKRPNFGSLFRKWTIDSPNVTVALEKRVVDMRFEEDRVQALILQDGSEVRANICILSAGTVSSIRLLLSMERRKVVPWSGNSLVGSCFHDHIAAPVASVVIEDEGKLRLYFENAVVEGVKVQPKLKWSDTARMELGSSVPAMSGYFLFHSDLSEHVASLKHIVRSLQAAREFSALRDFPKAALSVGRSFAPFVWRYIRERRVMAFLDAGASFQVQGEQFPIAASRISLADEVGPDGLPKADVHWEIDGREMHAITRFASDVDRYLQCRQIGRLVIDQQVKDENPAFLRNLIDTNHSAGGARMASDLSAGVVDADLKLFGTSNLYLASAAVFPTSSHANCTLTLLALASRLADKVKEEWHAG